MEYCTVLLSIMGVVCPLIVAMFCCQTCKIDFTISFPIYPFFFAV